MAKLTRGITFANNERLTPAKLNNLINQTVLNDIQSSDFDADFQTYYYGPSAPGVTLGRCWYDTTSGSEGLKFAFLSASNASVKGWLHAFPRREAYYWCATSCSLGTPLFVGSRKYETDLTDRQWTLYDGSIFPNVTPLPASASAEGLSPAMVVAMESRTGSGPVKAAWCGLIPADVSTAAPSARNALFADPTSPARLQAGGFCEFAKGLKGYWPLSEASGATRTDKGSGGHHAIDNGGVATATGKLYPLAASYASDTTHYLQIPHHADLAGEGTTGSYSVVLWCYLGSKAADQYVAEKWTASGNDREWIISYQQSTDNMRAVIGAGTATTKSHLHAENPPLDEWFLFFLHYNGSTGDITTQINGGAPTISNFASGVGPPASGADIIIGKSSDGDNRPLIGRVQGLGIWKNFDLEDWRNRHLLYNQGHGRADIRATGNTKSLIYGLALRDVATPASLPSAYLHWGTGPVSLDIDGTP